MKRIFVSFHENPAAVAALYLHENGKDPLRTLVVSPTQRFKSYLASELLRITGADAMLSPRIETSAQLIQLCAAYTGLDTAGDIKRLSMLYTAFHRTAEIDTLFPGDTFKSFRQFRHAARMVSGVFDELAGEGFFLAGDDADPEWYGVPRAPERSSPGAVSETGEKIPGVETGANEDRRRLIEKAVLEDSRHRPHLEILRNLYEQYTDVQKETGIFDMGFLLGQAGGEAIEAVFRGYDEIVLVSPLSLTAFEERMHREISDRLTVICQDTRDYDFSRIIAFREGAGTSELDDSEAGPSSNKTAIHGAHRARLQFFETSSRINEVMLCCTIIKRELDSGIPEERIAVINIDSPVCEMLRSALGALGIGVNMTRGVSVKKSPLFQFFQLTRDFFYSGMDTSLLLQLVGNEFFIELSGLSVDRNRLKRDIVKNRLFRLRSLECDLIKQYPQALSTLKNLLTLYRSRGFGELYDRLADLFGGFGEKKTYDYYAVRDVLFESACELADLSAGFAESPFDIFVQHAGSKKYSLLGSFESGVQVLGLLESRGICFDTVIIPGFNEGIFPVRGQSDIFLNRGMRERLGIPTFLDREELQLYYLMRIVDASKRTFIVSVDDPSGENGVQSRFAVILRDMCDVVEPENAEAEEYLLPVCQRETIRKKAITMPRMSERVRAFSRLDAQRIKLCETQYYIARVLGIDSEEEIQKEIDLSLIGRKVHRMFYDLYGSFDFSRGVPRRDTLKKRLKSLFEDAFREGCFFTAEETLMKKILWNNLIKCIEHDVRRFNDGYRVLTEYGERELQAEIGDGMYTIGGRIDRIDLSPSMKYVIMDYKTGVLPRRTDHLAGSNYRQIQLGFYGLLFSKLHPDAEIEGIGYFDINSKNGYVEVLTSGEIEEYLDEFERYLIYLFDAFNSRDRLSLANDIGNCAYCPFYILCRVYEQ